MSELVSNGVQIYQFPTEDEAVAEINSSMNVSPRNTQTHTYNTLHVCILQGNTHCHFLHYCVFTKPLPILWYCSTHRGILLVKPSEFLPRSDIFQQFKQNRNISYVVI